MTLASNMLHSQYQNELTVPAYFLYGEEHSDANFNFIHVEPLRTRNEFNSWKINRHYHPDINQISLLLKGECQFEHDGVFRYVNKPSCVITPAGLVHEFSYKPQSIGYGWICNRSKYINRWWKFSRYNVKVVDEGDNKGCI